MRKLTCIIVLVLLVFLSNIAFCEENHDFRNSDWGMTKEEVRLAEGDVEWNDNGDGYVDVVGMMNCIVGFGFDSSGVLQTGVLDFSNDHTNDYLYISDFETLSSALKEKYGYIFDEKEVWLDDLFKNDKSQWGLAVASGQLMMMSTWENDRTTIQLILTGDNFKVSLGILYSDKNNPVVTNMDGI